MALTLTLFGPTLCGDKYHAADEQHRDANQDSNSMFHY
jgi:hypothetical protein